LQWQTLTVGDVLDIRIVKLLVTRLEDGRDAVIDQTE